MTTQQCLSTMSPLSAEHSRDTLHNTTYTFHLNLSHSYSWNTAPQHKYRPHSRAAVGPLCVLKAYLLWMEKRKKTHPSVSQADTHGAAACWRGLESASVAWPELSSSPFTPMWGQGVVLGCGKLLHCLVMSALSRKTRPCFSRVQGPIRPPLWSNLFYMPSFPEDDWQLQLWIYYMCTVWWSYKGKLTPPLYKAIKAWIQHHHMMMNVS